MSQPNAPYARPSREKPTDYAAVSRQARTLCYRAVLVGFVSYQKKVTNHGVQSEGGRRTGRSSCGGGNNPYDIGRFYGTRIGKAHRVVLSFAYSDAPSRVRVSV